MGNFFCSDKPSMPHLNYVGIPNSCIEEYFLFHGRYLFKTFVEVNRKLDSVKCLFEITISTKHPDTGQ